MSFYYYRHCLYFKGFVFDFYTFTIKAALIFLIVLALSSALVYYSGYQKDYIFELPVIFFFLSFFLLFLCSCFNFISIFVCTEGITFCLAALIIHNYGYDDASYAGMKYLILGSLASGMFIFGAVLLFGLSGTTNFF
jgi:NADH-quinone oxidoreductase subunit N